MDVSALKIGIDIRARPRSRRTRFVCGFLGVALLAFVGIGTVSSVHSVYAPESRPAITTVLPSKPAPALPARERPERSHEIPAGRLLLHVAQHWAANLNLETLCGYFLA